MCVVFGLWTHDVGFASRAAGSLAWYFAIVPHVPIECLPVTFADNCTSTVSTESTQTRMISAVHLRSSTRRALLVLFEDVVFLGGFSLWSRLSYVPHKVS